MPRPPSTAPKEAIQAHYDRLSGLYRTFWGEHLHHGYFEGSANLVRAQERLIEELAVLGQLRRGMHVLDIGCGLGGSCRWLARNLGAQVTGLTLSPVQARMARRAAQREDLQRRIRFLVGDAETIEFETGTADALWIIECSEHFHDKAGFFARAAGWLRPGGMVALAAWLAVAPEDPAHARRLERIRRAMLCPSFGTATDYTGWLAGAGLELVAYRDVTPQVAPTWDRCMALAATPPVRWLLQASAESTRAFVASFAEMRAAYEEGSMAYGLFAARSPLWR